MNKRYIDVSKIRLTAESSVDSSGDVLVSIADVRRALSQTPTADVVELQGLTPCDVCAYNPPSSGDGKPCTMCPARAKIARQCADGWDCWGNEAPES